MFPAQLSPARPKRFRTRNFTNMSEKQRKALLLNRISNLLCRIKRENKKKTINISLKLPRYYIESEAFNVAIETTTPYERNILTDQLLPYFVSKINSFVVHLHTISNNLFTVPIKAGTLRI